MQSPGPPSPPAGTRHSPQLFAEPGTAGSEVATQAHTPPRSSPGPAAPAAAAVRLWALPRCAADLAPPPRFVALANATTLLAAYGSQSFAIIGERSACRLLGEALGNPSEQVTSAWTKLGELSDDARKALVSELWHGHLRALVPDADRKAALNFVFTLFGKRGVALLAGVARTLHGLSADECHAWCAVHALRAQPSAPSPTRPALPDGPALPAPPSPAFPPAHLTLRPTAVASRAGTCTARWAPTGSTRRGSSSARWSSPAGTW